MFDEAEGPFLISGQMTLASYDFQPFEESLAPRDTCSSKNFEVRLPCRCSGDKLTEDQR